MNLTCVMISCRQRRSAQQATAEQFEALGIPVKIFESPCNPASRLGNGYVSRAALGYGIARPDPVLFIEDDIDLADDFLAFLQMALDAALSSEAVTYLYLNEQLQGRATLVYGRELAGQIYGGDAIRRQLAKANIYEGLYGTQCVLLPRSVAVGAFHLLAQPKGPLDGTLIDLYLRRQPPAFVAVPNPVQHRNVRIARDHHGIEKRSYSYDCPRQEEA